MDVGAKSANARGRTSTVPSMKSTECEVGNVEQRAICFKCEQEVNQKQKKLECEICEDWFHIECCIVSKRCYESFTDKSGNMSH